VCAKEIEKVRDDERREEERKRKERGVEEGVMTTPTTMSVWTQDPSPLRRAKSIRRGQVSCVQTYIKPGIGM
jgi:hypothetical protein